MSIREIKDYEILKLSQSTAQHEGKSIFWIISLNDDLLAGYESLAEQVLSYRFEERNLVVYFQGEPVLVLIEDAAKDCNVEELLSGNVLLVGGLNEKGEVSIGFTLIPA